MGNPWRPLVSAAGERLPVARGARGEQAARACAAQIIQNLAEQCSLIDDDCAQQDREWADLIRQPFRRTRTNVPTIPASIYLGAQPSLVQGASARFDKWPAITVRCGPLRASSDPEQPDHFDSLDADLIVECLAVAGPFDLDPVEDRVASDEIDRQYQRLSDAVIACVDLDRSLGGNVLTIKRPPTMTPSLPEIMRESKGAGRWLLYQGMELSWGVTLLTK